MSDKRGALPIISLMGSRLLLVFVLLVVAVGSVIVSLAEYAKTGRCYLVGSTLSAEELRMKTIRSLLLAKMEEAASLNETAHETILIRKSVTASDVIDAIASKSIVNWSKEAAYPLNTGRDVANVDSSFLRGDFSIVQYSPTGVAAIIPSRSIEAVDAGSSPKYFGDKKKAGFELSIFERARGYGNHLFKLNVFGYIDLACCEESYARSPKEGFPQARYARDNIAAITRGEQPAHRHLIVSNCGDILHRSVDENVDRDQYIF